VDAEPVEYQRDDGRDEEREHDAEHDEILVVDEADAAPPYRAPVLLAEHELGHALDSRNRPRGAEPEQQRAGGGRSPVTEWVLQAEVRVHVDEGQVQARRVAEEEVQRYPELTEFLRVIKST